MKMMHEREGERESTPGDGVDCSCALVAIVRMSCPNTSLISAPRPRNANYSRLHTWPDKVMVPVDLRANLDWSRPSRLHESQVDCLPSILPPSLTLSSFILLEMNDLSIYLTRCRQDDHYAPDPVVGVAVAMQRPAQPPSALDAVTLHCNTSPAASLHDAGVLAGQSTSGHRHSTVDEHWFDTFLEYYLYFTKQTQYGW